MIDKKWIQEWALEAHAGSLSNLIISYERALEDQAGSISNLMISEKQNQLKKEL